MDKLDGEVGSYFFKLGPEDLESEESMGGILRRRQFLDFPGLYSVIEASRIQAWKNLNSTVSKFLVRLLQVSRDLVEFGLHLQERFVLLYK